MLVRAFSKFVPKISPKFDNKGRILLYSYNDDNTSRQLAGLSALSSIASLSYLSWFPSSTTALFVAIGSVSMSLFSTIACSSTVVEIYLTKGGQKIEVMTLSKTGVRDRQGLTKKPKVVDISSILAIKSQSAFMIQTSKHFFTLNLTDGVIHREDYFYAVMRGLPIEQD
jgi:hypothetical protein